MLLSPKTLERFSTEINTVSRNQELIALINHNLRLVKRRRGQTLTRTPTGGPETERGKGFAGSGSVVWYERAAPFWNRCLVGRRKRSFYLEGSFQGQTPVGEKGKHIVEVSLILLALALVLLGSNKQWLQDTSNLPRWSFNPDV